MHPFMFSFLTETTTELSTNDLTTTDTMITTSDPLGLVVPVDPRASAGPGVPGADRNDSVPTADFGLDFDSADLAPTEPSVDFTTDSNFTLGFAGSSLCMPD